MTDVSKQMALRGGIVAAAGVLIGTICQASLTDPGQCRPASNTSLAVISSEAPRDGARPLSIDERGRACASSYARLQRARVAEPEFLHVDVVEIAGGARSASN